MIIATRETEESTETRYFMEIVHMDLICVLAVAYKGLLGRLGHVCCAKFSLLEDNSHLRIRHIAIRTILFLLSFITTREVKS